MKTKLLTTFAAMVLCACGGGASKNGANTNSTSSNSTASASPSPSATRAEVLGPTTMDAYDVATHGYQKENEGRIVTVTGGQLEKIQSTYLQIITSGGGFQCNGDFNEYMSMSTRIDDMRYKNKSPTVTVKGVYAKANYANSATINDCILTDLKK